ncbi:universal stress protein [Oenococcus alcoholitolerans]|uniref:universal stress protein n=1 Tax=Oenococcus alcoholitolerans TaxID=931074 RepID=UPI003F6F2269
MAYKKILVGIDGSKQSDRAFERALDLAEQFSAELHILSIVNRDRAMILAFGANEDIYQDQYQRDKDRLTSYAKKADDRGVKNVTKTVIGDAKQILARDYPNDNDIDLIILGNTGLNAVEQILIGSHSSFVVRNSKVDVLIVK